MANLENLYSKTGGFMKGICHPGSDRESLLELGLRWVRRDIPYPFDKNGNETPEFISYRKACEYYAEKGIYTVGITPYPSAFIAAGIDVSTEAGLNEAAEVCRKIAVALKDSVKCWQVTNEMHIIHFRAPLTEAESIRFLIKCTLGLRAGDPEGCIGHNSYCEAWRGFCKDIERETGGNDYIGMDCYAGTWGPGNTDTYIEEIDILHDALGIPVILMEFGYASTGNVREDEEADAEIDRFLHAHGFKDREDAMERNEDLMKFVPETLANTAKRCSEADRRTYILSSMNHVLKHWRYSGGFTHSEEGQAQFYGELLPKLLKNPHLGGAILYCWQDSPSCFTCGQSDCPCETAWGITRMDGTRKPSCEIIKKVFAE
ncbi:MAG: hypothetical protein IKZ19_02545 [Clostridia bacterium]|nr:hypothetical protein [Clostridia bacterium]